MYSMLLNTRILCIPIWWCLQNYLHSVPSTHHQAIQYQNGLWLYKPLHFATTPHVKLSHINILLTMISIIFCAYFQSPLGHNFSLVLCSNIFIQINSQVSRPTKLLICIGTFLSTTHGISLIQLQLFSLHKISLGISFSMQLQFCG